MSYSIRITDDGDEVVIVAVHSGDKQVFSANVDHETFGWHGMFEVIKILTDIAEILKVPVVDTQVIV